MKGTAKKTAGILACAAIAVSLAACGGRVSGSAGFAAAAKAAASSTAAKTDTAFAAASGSETFYTDRPGYFCGTYDGWCGGYGYGRGGSCYPVPGCRGGCPGSRR